jgi:ROK family
MGKSRVVLAVDIGAGIGAKIGLFNGLDAPFAEHVLNRNEYGTTFGSFTESLSDAIESLLASEGLSRLDVAGCGIACPGILRADRSFQLLQNLPHWNGHNLPRALEQAFGFPTGIENDANAGGLAEWSVLRLELLYWVFGGGWGGVWISRDGVVRFPALDWDGSDDSLHFTNEPGYAIPLDKVMLKMAFHEVGAPFERFERLLVEEFQPDGGIVTGPCGNPDTVRAEIILSGPGRCRLFRTLVGDDDFYERFLSREEALEMADPATAGKHISKMSAMRVEAAVNTDRLYGKVLAIATRIMLKAAYKDGMPEGVPICLGGKPSYALPYFGPSAQRAMGRLGILSYLRPSVIDERGSNANLVGAAVLARQIAATGSPA